MESDRVMILSQNCCVLNSTCNYQEKTRENTGISVLNKSYGRKFKTFQIFLKVKQIS